MAIFHVPKEIILKPGKNASAFCGPERGKKEGIMLVKRNKVANSKEVGGRALKIYAFV